MDSFKQSKTSLDNKLKEDVKQVAKMLQVEFEAHESIEEYQADVDKKSYLNEKSWDDIVESLKSEDYQFDERILRRYHLSLMNGRMVILSGVSGTGKTLLTQLYAKAVDADLLIVPVAPNWTENEDLIGYYSIIDNTYHDTEFSLFLRKAYIEHEAAKNEKRAPKPFHVVFDEMNLSKVEHYFSKFLSLLELRTRNNEVRLIFQKDDEITIPSNIFFVGTVNVDESTEDFSDKVFDRSQLIELTLNEENIKNYIDDFIFGDLLFEIWLIVRKAAPFAYRTINEIIQYVNCHNIVKAVPKDLFDEQVLQKILPKFNGSHEEYGKVLNELVVLFSSHELVLSLDKTQSMLKEYDDYGITSYF
ncbi:MAG: AAA family ATPase [Clostridia bacterium]|nr:AAA family ATPase [Clostridia bacterium]